MGLVPRKSYSSQPSTPAAASARWISGSVSVVSMVSRVPRFDRRPANRRAIHTRLRHVPTQRTCSTAPMLPTKSASSSRNDAS